MRWPRPRGLNGCCVGRGGGGAAAGGAGECGDVGINVTSPACEGGVTGAAAGQRLVAGAERQRGARPCPFLCLALHPPVSREIPRRQAEPSSDTVASAQVLSPATSPQPQRSDTNHQTNPQLVRVCRLTRSGSAPGGRHSTRSAHSVRQSSLHRCAPPAPFFSTYTHSTCVGAALRGCLPASFPEPRLPPGHWSAPCHAMPCEHGVCSACLDQSRHATQQPVLHAASMGKRGIFAVLEKPLEGPVTVRLAVTGGGGVLAAG
eukprot:364568-Chlamydomonas_euryale.AAC.3